MESDSVENLQEIANAALIQIFDWANSVKLNFTPNKIQLISFSKKGKRATIKFNTNNLNYPYEIKIIGIIIDQKQKFIKHFGYIIAKAQKLYRKLCIFTALT